MVKEVWETAMHRPKERGSCQMRECGNALQQDLQTNIRGWRHEGLRLRERHGTIDDGNVEAEGAVEREEFQVGRKSVDGAVLRLVGEQWRAKRAMAEMWLKSRLSKVAGIGQIGAVA